ncbi:MAG TPA: serine hydrolase domain-containing protein [Bacteroidota bacterium]|nr:serine hydrolase domain-containing protein [Bacteroidota bacterium]
MKNISLLLAWLILAAVSCAQSSKVFVQSKPEQAGMSSERMARIDRFMNEQVEKQNIPGAVAFVARHGKIVYFKSFGYDDIELHTPLRNDRIFRIASQTKAITSVAALMLFEQGAFGLDDPVSKYIPEFQKPVVLKSFNASDSSYTAEPAKREITIRQLFTHTSGLGYPGIGSKEMKAIYAKAGVPSGVGNSSQILAEKMKVLAKQPLIHEPGERFTYGLSVDVLGYLVELCSGMPLDRYFKEKIFTPLGMNDTYFYLPKEKYSRLACLYEEQDGTLRKMKSNVEGDPNYPCLDGTYFSGGAGLSSTIEDYAKFLQMVLNGGVYNGTRLLGRKTVELLLTNQITPKVSETMQFGLGFQLETAVNDHLSPLSIGSFSWGGIFNTQYWADPKEELVGLVYTQIWPTKRGQIADRFKELVYQSIIE